MAPWCDGISKSEKARKNMGNVCRLMGVGPVEKGGLDVVEDEAG